MNIKDTKNFLKELNTFPKKHLGQNFLINPRIAQKIISEVKKTKGPWMEIGPGAGALTRLFSEDEKNKLTLIERDRRIVNYWREKHFSVLSQDALKTDWDQLSHPITLFGNLPYQLAGPLILQLSSFSNKIRSMIFMMQKEVSLRVRAKPRTKDYGLLSVMAQTFWNIQWIAEAGTKDFYPPPKVTGQVLKLLPKNPPLPAGDFLLFLKSCFSQRRKKLIRRLPASLSQAEAFLSETGHNTNTRAEELSPGDFIYLYRKILCVSNSLQQ